MPVSPPVMQGPQVRSPRFSAENRGALYNSSARLLLSVELCGGDQTGVQINDVGNCNDGAAEHLLFQRIGNTHGIKGVLQTKAVATLYGFLFGLFACGGYSIRFFLFPLLTFLLVLKCTRIISLSSMLSAAAVVFYAWFAGAPLPVTLALVFFAALIVIRHRPNLIRMYRHEENKVSWI